MRILKYIFASAFGKRRLLKVKKKKKKKEIARIKVQLHSYGIQDRRIFYKSI